MTMTNKQYHNWIGKKNVKITFENIAQQFGVIDSFDNATYDMQEGYSAWQTIIQ